MTFCTYSTNMLLFKMKCLAHIPNATIVDFPCLTHQGTFTFSAYKMKHLLLKFPVSSNRRFTKMEDVKLLGAWASPFSRRIEMALKLKGVKYEYVEEDLSNKSSSLLHYNPIHKKIPVLIHNGKPIAESLVILEYIDETWKESFPLLPSDPYGKAGARFWAKFISEQCMPALWKACANPNEELMAEAMSHLSKLEDELKGKKLFGGETIGLVDIAACFIAHWLAAVQEARGMEKLLITKERFPRLAKWSEEFCSADGVKENLPEKEKIVAVFKGMFAAARTNEPGKYVPKV